MFQKAYLLLFLIIIGISIGCTNSQISPTDITCEYLTDPSVVDVKQPRLAWINIAQEGVRGQYQTAWEIRVASSKTKLSNPDLWDSGKQISDQSNRIEYGGKPLTSRQECWWQVRTWDREDNVSGWSNPGFWRMGLLDSSDWTASWIGAPWQGEEALPKPQGGPNALPVEYPPPAPLFRKAFTIDKEVEKAVAYVTGLGYFELYLNGQKVGDDVLTPNQTNYGKRPDLTSQNIPLPDDFKEYKVMYLAYDIKKYLKEGENVIGSILGNGFFNAPKYWVQSYGSPRFISQLHITYKDGSEDIISSDTSWKVSKSAILMDLVYHGEHYDARKEQPGWAIVGFKDEGWENAVLRKSPYGKLVAHTAYTDKIMEEIQPVSIEKTGEGTFLVDFGVEISGWLRLNEVEAPAGHQIEMKYISNQYSGDNSYTFRGEGPETYHARFNWFVFSAVEIKNWYGELNADDLTALAVNTYIDETATFETSNQLFNDINKIWKRSQLDNMHGGIASDCPHRERAPYTGDGQVACVTVMHNYDARNFYQKWIQDILGAQVKSTGYVPNGAPWEPGCGGGVAWGAAINIMPWEFYQQYGSVDILVDNYDGMKEYVDYMTSWINKNGTMLSERTGRDGKVLRWFNLGEWSWPDELQVSDNMVHTFYFWRCADITSKVAGILGKTEESEKYRILAENMKEAFHNTFFNEEIGSYGNGGGNIFALRMGVPQDRYEKVITALKNNIIENDGHLDTGIFGTQFFFEALSDHGMQDLAYNAMNKRTMPSYGYWLEQGSTTTREDWDNSGSHNHPMFGGGLVWLYRKLAGMNIDPEEPGYKHIIFKPQPVDDLDFISYYNKTPFGRAGISWEYNDGAFAMYITVPVGSTATVYIPSKNGQLIIESGKDLEKLSEVSFIEVGKEYTSVKVQSGDYHFMVK